MPRPSAPQRAQSPRAGALVPGTVAGARSGGRHTPARSAPRLGAHGAPRIAAATGRPRLERCCPPSLACLSPCRGRSRPQCCAAASGASPRAARSTQARPRRRTTDWGTAEARRVWFSGRGGRVAVGYLGGVLEAQAERCVARSAQPRPLELVPVGCLGAHDAPVLYAAAGLVDVSDVAVCVDQPRASTGGGRSGGWERSDAERQQHRLFARWSQLD